MRLFLVLAATAALASGCAGRNPAVVHADGWIGPFRLDVSTEREVRGRLGKPEGAFRDPLRL
jgi:hypothetical protein